MKNMLKSELIFYKDVKKGKLTIEINDVQDLKSLYNYFLASASDQADISEQGSFPMEEEEISDSFNLFDAIDDTLIELGEQ